MAQLRGEEPMITEATIVFAAAVIFAGLYMVAKEVHLLGMLFWYQFNKGGDNEG
jgi:hypothetical protein